MLIPMPKAIVRTTRLQVVSHCLGLKSHAECTHILKNLGSHSSMMQNNVSVAFFVKLSTQELNNQIQNNILTWFPKRFAVLFHTTSFLILTGNNPFIPDTYFASMKQYPYKMLSFIVTCTFISLILYLLRVCVPK